MTTPLRVQEVIAQATLLREEAAVIRACTDLLSSHFLPRDGTLAAKKIPCSGGHVSESTITVMITKLSKEAAQRESDADRLLSLPIQEDV